MCPHSFESQGIGGVLLLRGVFCPVQAMRAMIPVRVIYLNSFGISVYAQTGIDLACFGPGMKGGR